ncbi:hypothetical protein COY16_02730 [Candidatus Roizmanbacteria bacterium CG_4_10_14_0_2_um_filter_39_13]|uniref:Uncharacterized protein n=1 Tax=Candidatus Roizmanbacteria bacterium CG_4_10_14_0_2_um_filter_39_13 TaxID=1974825 RepID=A0A2M7TZ66_9BACT|nr:MAG: hypothetical protein COY16_02730 [Candidatus Roizmanbacteria bacterium CG_4_10_14_0_2_um_filter_39_13]
MNKLTWIPRALLLVGIVLGALVLGPQPLMAQEALGYEYFEPSQEDPIRVDCGNGELYDWTGGELPVRFSSMEVEVSPGRWCSMEFQPPDWVSGMTIITLIAAFLLVAAIFVFRWRFKRQNSAVRLDEVFEENLYFQ